MKIKTLTLAEQGLPEELRQIPSPPKQLYCLGSELSDLMQRPRVAIVGSRAVTPYGQQVTLQLARELAERGIVIISGLALGVDALAHQAALEAGGKVIAVLPGPKDVLAVPGNITVPTAVGVNNLLKSGATPVTSYLDVLHTLGLQDHQTPARQIRGRNAHEQAVLDLLLRGVNDGETLLERSALSISEFNQVITMLEIGGKIRSLGANQWSLR